MSDEERCLELIFHADAAKHPGLPNLLARQNLAYLKLSQSLMRQRAALKESLEALDRQAATKVFDDILHVEEVLEESLWADCLADCQEILGRGA